MAHLDKAETSEDGMGFWAEKAAPLERSGFLESLLEKHAFAWLNEAAPEYENLEEMVLDQLLLDRAQALAYDRVRTRDRNDALDKILAFERDLTDEQAPEISQLVVQNSKVQPLDFNVYERTALSNLPFEMVSAIMTLYSFPPFVQEAKQLRWLIRCWCQLRARDYYADLNRLSKLQKRQRWLRRLLQQRTQLKFVYPQNMFEHYRNACIDFTLLELRTQGKLPPWEGILLVKEYIANI